MDEDEDDFDFFNYMANHSQFMSLVRRCWNKGDDGGLIQCPEEVEM